MKISKSIILPEWESIESLEQAGDILHKITEAMKDHQIQNYEDSVASFRQITTGRIQSHDGQTYFDLDSGVIRGEIVFRPGSSGLDNVEEASVNDWDNAFRLADAVKGDSDFTLISGGKIITNSIAVGAFNSDVVARMFSSGASQEAIEAWMKSGHITYIDGNKIYAGSITLTGLGTTIIDGGYIKTSLLTASHIRTGYLQTVQFRCGGGTDEDIYFEDSGIRMYDGGTNDIGFSKAGLSGFGITLESTGVALKSTENILKLIANTQLFLLYNTGQLGLANVGSDPVSNLAAGQLCSVSGVLKYYDGAAWKTVTVT